MFESIPQILLILGIVTLIAELVVFGFATLFLLFLAFSMCITSGIMYAGLLEVSWLNAISSCTFLTLFLAILLWKPLRKLQNHHIEKKIHSDFAEISFVLDKDLTPDANYFYAYSGIQWQLKSSTTLLKGTHVKVTQKEVGVFWVEPIQ